MKYERLTERDDRDFIDIIGVDSAGIYKGLDMDESMFITRAIRRLAELEDKIEDGTLVEVPKEVVVYTPGVVLTPEERAEEMRPCNDERRGAVKEFAEKLKSHIILNYTMDGEFVEDINIWSLFKDIENLVEEVEE